MVNLTEWSRISEEDFKTMQFDSGMIVRNFDPSKITPPADSDIVVTTSGSITVSLVPQMANLGDDVNNLHGDFAELEYLQKWTATLGFTALNMSTETIKLVLGAADISGDQVAPRMYLSLSDFGDLTWIGLCLGGGFMAVTLSSALSTGGFNLTTTKEGKGNLAVTMTGFMRMNAQGVPPMKFYSLKAEDEDTAA